MPTTQAFLRVFDSRQFHQKTIQKVGKNYPKCYVLRALVVKIPTFYIVFTYSLGSQKVSQEVSQEKASVLDAFIFMLNMTSCTHQSSILPR